MKKALSLVIAFIMIFSTLTMSVFAAETENVVSETIEYLDDGCYIVTTLVSETNPLARATSVTAYKTSSLYNSDDEKLVTLKLTATFTYTGSSSTCTAASASYTIINDAWKVTSATATKSGNKATANFTSKQYFLGVAIQTINSTITLTCSSTGTLS